MFQNQQLQHLLTKKILSASISLVFLGVPLSGLSDPLKTGQNTLNTDSAIASVQKLSSSELTLEAVYRAKPYAGHAAKHMHFSEDGRYLAYLWNPFGETGFDLYLYDNQNGTTRRITSFEIMQGFDAPEVTERFLKKLQQKQTEEQQQQEKAEAHAAYLRGEKVDLYQWESAALETLKIELSDKKRKDAAKKKELDALAAIEKSAMAELAKSKAANAKANQTELLQTSEKSAEKTVDKALEKAVADKAASDKAEDKELWELRDELKKKIAKNKLKNSDLYPGVSDLVWAKKNNELVFEYRGDLFRLFASSGKVERLTQTDKTEHIIAYHNDDKSYLFQDGKHILSASFSNGQTRQLNPELIHPDDAEKKYKIRNTVLSDNKQWMAITAQADDAAPESGKPAASAERQVEIMNYSERFATAKKVSREVSDDKRKVLASALYIRKVNSAQNADKTQAQRQPVPVFTNDGGDVWFEMSAVQWSKDNSKYTFSTWEREKELLKIYVGKAEEGVKPELVFERRGNVGHEVVNVLAPQFTPDGKSLIAVLDDNGYRQPFRIEKNQAFPLLKGDFEAHQILGFTPDSQTMFVLANRDDFAAMNVFKVSLASGTMTALGKAGDFHRASSLSEDAKQIASVAGQWSQRPELQLIGTQVSNTSAATPANIRKTLTSSHDPAWQAVDVLRPTRFSYNNRHGDAIQAYVFKPANWSATDQRPAVIYTYGGPLNDRHIIETDSFQSTAYLFGMYMAAKHGYLMVAVDPRGHSNYGRKFSDANWEQPGKPQTEDLEDLAKYMSQNLGADAKRIGLTGWSFGGFQTQFSMYTSPDTFAAGIAGAGPTEWENYNSWYSGRTIGKTERSKPNLRRYSLLPLTAGLKKPLLLVHGMQDPNVLYQDTVNVYRALLENGKESLVDLFLDPDGDHGMDGVVKAKGRHKKYESFFLQHLGKGN